MEYTIESEYPCYERILINTNTTHVPSDYYVRDASTTATPGGENEKEIHPVIKFF